MKKLNLSTDDLFEALRGCGYFSLADVQYAIMETNGKMSVMPKAESAPVTNGDLKTQAEDSFLPITLVSEGKIIKENISLAGFDTAQVEQIAKQQGCKQIKDILILQIDKQGNGYIQPKNGEGKSFTSKRLVSK